MIAGLLVILYLVPVNCIFCVNNSLFGPKISFDGAFICCIPNLVDNANAGEDNDEKEDEQERGHCMCCDLIGPILGGLHIQFRPIQIFLLFYFYSFNIVFEDKPLAVLTS